MTATPSTSSFTIQPPKVVKGVVEIQDAGELIYMDNHQNHDHIQTNGVAP